MLQPVIAAHCAGGSGSCFHQIMMMMMMMLVMFNVQYNDELLLHGVMTKGSQYDEHLKKQKHAGPANRV